MDSDVQKYLPHRPPFAFLDEFDVTDGGNKICGTRTFTDDDFFVKGHFPGYPVVPGVILVESMAQCGGAGLIKAAKLPKDATFLLASIKSAKFHHKVVPGDKFEMIVETIRTMKNRFLVQCGHGFVNGVCAVEAEWVCAIIPKAE